MLSNSSELGVDFVDGLITVPCELLILMGSVTLIKSLDCALVLSPPSKAD